jgi:hypothetical protein
VVERLEDDAHSAFADAANDLVPVGPAPFCRGASYAALAGLLVLGAFVALTIHRDLEMLLIAGDPC